MQINELKQRLIDAGHILENAGQGDLTRGHVSIRLPDDPTHFIMKPHSYGFDEITLENIVLCNLEGEKVGGPAIWRVTLLKMRRDRPQFAERIAARGVPRQ